MRKIMIILFTGTVLTSIYAGVNFENGVSQDELKKQIEVTPVPDVKYVPGQVRYTRDCVRFTFGPSDTEIMSEKVRLRSDEYRTECYTYYVPGPNGQQIPQQNCYEHFVASYYGTAQINIKQRKLLPWEKEHFEVCMEGPWIDLYTIQAGYKYKVKKIGYNDVLFELYPEQKIKTDPDIDGLNYVEFSYDKNTNKYTFIVRDKWFKEYAGEKVYIKIELKKDKANWFDPSVGIKEYTFDVAPEYRMEFSEDELVQPQNNTADDNNYRNGEKLFEIRGYYLKWGFKRIGELSKDTYMDKGKTNTIQK